MRISDLIKMGLKNLSRRKARTALTVIGVVIGTISIIVMVSIGIGMNASYESQIMQSGSLTTIDVQKDSYSYNKEEDDYSYKQQKLDDAFVQMVAQMDHVKAVTPYVSQYFTMTSGKYESTVQLFAFDSSTMEDFDFPAVVKGDAPSDTNKEVLLFGSKVLSDFYNPNSYMGESKEIDPERDRINFGFAYWEYNLAEGKKEFKTNLRSYGILEELNDYNYDYCVFTDIEYYTKLFEKYTKTLSAESRKVALKSLEQYTNVKICVDSVKHVEEVQKQIEELGYQTSSLQSAMEPIKEASNMLQLVLGCIGGVSMLVSAISIANTMIMSIYERTKEIGVMKVLGCFVRDVKKLFLFESAMIGLIGGALGVGLSYLASWAINKYGGPIFESLMQTSYMYDASTSKFSLIPLWLPIAALLFAMMIGIISGYYPARRATRISAIEAMKTEG